MTVGRRRRCGGWLVASRSEALVRKDVELHDVQFRLIVRRRVIGAVNVPRKHWLIGQIRRLIEIAAPGTYTIEVAEATVRRVTE